MLVCLGQCVGSTLPMLHPPGINFEMAPILSSVFGRTKAYEPSPRCFQYAAPIGERLFLWGGRVPDFSASGRRNLASTVDIFDPYLETWKQQSTSGALPPGLYNGASASISNLYSFGGFDGASSYNSFHTLNSTTLQWNELQVLNQAEGPMRKRGCKMVVYSQDKTGFVRRLWFSHRPQSGWSIVHQGHQLH